VLSDRRSQRILIADDHSMFAETLRVYLIGKGRTVVGVVQDGHAVIREAMKLRPDAIVVDVGMPLLNGLDVARRIKSQDAKIKFVFLTMHDDATLAAAALELGPVAFVLKHSTGAELLRAIDHVMEGHPYLTPRLRTEHWEEAKAKASRLSRELTNRQRDVIQLFAEGRSQKEIASLLHLSQKTVEFHKHHVMESFNLRSNADLVLFAVKQGLIHVDKAHACLSYLAD